MTLAAFLRRELAPFPGRLRATGRIVVGCLAALLFTVVFGTGVVPHAHWTIFTIFTVSQSDAGASLRKSMQRVVGTVVGGLMAIAAVVLLADLPVFYVPLVGVVIAAAMFASLTTTASYVMLLGGITFVLAAFFPLSDASSAVHTGLWRIVAIMIGVICGTAAQLFVWPDDPEDKLRHALAARLDAVARVIRDLATRARSGAAGALPSPLRLAGDDVMVQLDLLGNAEIRHPSLRQRHTEQLSLIIEIDRLVTSAAWLVDRAAEADTGPPPDSTRDPEDGAREPAPSPISVEPPGEASGELAVSRLEAIGVECRALSAALASARPPAPHRREAMDAPRTSGATRDVSIRDVLGLRPLLADMELSAERVRAALGFLEPDRPTAPALDRPARTPLLTPAFSLRNRPALMLAIKTGFAVSICYVLMHALVWGAFLSAAVTCLLVALTSFGAVVQKALLRVVGALFGGALGIVAIVVAMPNIETVAGLVVISTIGFAIAAWITAGSSRISYIGLQTGMAFVMCVIDPEGPTTDLTPARDRVIGILLGIAVMLVVDVALGSARARLAMRPALARTLATIGGLARLAPDVRDYRARMERAVRLRGAVYGQLAATVRVSDESTREPDAATPDARAERAWIAALVGHAQAVFLALLSLMRHRLSPEFPALTPTVQDGLRELDDAIAALLEGLARRVEHGGATALPDLAERLAAAERLIRSEDDSGAHDVRAGPPSSAASVAVQTALRDHLSLAAAVVREVSLLRAAVDADPGPQRP